MKKKKRKRRRKKEIKEKEREGKKGGRNFFKVYFHVFMLEKYISVLKYRKHI